MTSLERLFAEQRARFPALVQGAGAYVVHLNNAAGSEMPDAAIEAMVRVMRSGFSNEGPIFRRLEGSRALVAEARRATADLVSCSPEEVGFGANTTTNLFYISRALARSFRPGDRVLVSEACHEANIAPWLALREQGMVVDFIPMREDTHLDYEWLESHIDERTRLISVGASSNGTGTIHDLPRVIRAARRASALVSVDAAHYVPHRPVSFAALDADLLFFSIYKCFGPHLGAFCVRRSLLERLPVFGLERPLPERLTAAQLETGTRSFEALAGWLGTLSYLEELGRSCLGGDASAPSPGARREALALAMDAIARWEDELTQHGDRRLSELPDLELYAQTPVRARPRLGVFCFNLRRAGPLQVAEALDRAGVEAVVGNYGAARTMARLASAHGGVGIRLSIAHYTTKADIDRAVECLLATPAGREDR
jgi:cysteine desulfurase family protein (TIGR01976 family)